jgi:hypothetical protein
MEAFGKPCNRGGIRIMFNAQAKFRSDPAASCAIIANTVLAELQAETPAPSAQVFANSLLRLLNSYRFGLKREEHSRGVLQFKPLAARVELIASQDGRVREAVAQAHEELFPGQSAEEVVGKLSNAVKHYFNLQGSEELGDVLSEDTLGRFLKSLKEQLHSAA